MLDRVARQAVTQQSWHKDSVRTAVAELREANPHADDTRLAALFAERMRGDDALLSAAAEYVVILSVNSLQRAQSSARPAPEPQERAARAAEMDRVVSSGKEQIVLLNMEMPNGKRMRWCSKDEMAKFGGAYTKISKRMGAGQNVGQALDEAAVRKIFGTAA